MGKDKIAMSAVLVDRKVQNGLVSVLTAGSGTLSKRFVSPLIRGHKLLVTQRQHSEKLPLVALLQH